jgi:hypothetical protein
VDKQISQAAVFAEERQDFADATLIKLYAIVFKTIVSK